MEGEREGGEIEKKERKRERASIFKSANLLPKCLQHPGLGQIISRSQEFHPDISHGCQEPTYLNCHLLPLKTIVGRKLETGAELVHRAKYSNMGCWGLKQRFNYCNKCPPLNYHFLLLLTTFTFWLTPFQFHNNLEYVPFPLWEKHYRTESFPLFAKGHLKYLRHQHLCV